MLKISAVPYLNAMPFVHGIRKSGLLKNYLLTLDIPSACAKKLLEGKADIALAPVAVISEMKKHFIVSDCCIGSDGPVRTVMLYSQLPLRQVKKIFLDYQSKTSVLLTKILARYFWKINPEWAEAKPGYEKKISGSMAGLVIGDRNFFLENKFAFCRDLSEEWKNFCGLPFVFACWISRKKFKQSEEKTFTRALHYGLEHTDEVIRLQKNRYGEKHLKEYFGKNIHYHFNNARLAAMELFLELGKKI